MWGLQHRKTRGPLFCSGFSTVTLDGGVILGHFAEYFLVGKDVFLSVVSILQCTMGPSSSIFGPFSRQIAEFQENISTFFDHSDPPCEKK